MDDLSKLDMNKLTIKAQEIQNKMEELAKKEYQGKFQGITIKMLGDFTPVDVKIEQSYYETASKSDLENGIKTLLANLHKAITAEQIEMREDFERQISDIKREMMLNGTN